MVEKVQWCNSKKVNGPENNNNNNKKKKRLLLKEFFFKKKKIFKLALAVMLLRHHVQVRHAPEKNMKSITIVWRLLLKEFEFFFTS
jgi:hypothetical protein